MRLFGFLGLVITLAIGMYIYSLQVKAIDPTSSSSAMATDAPLIAGVKQASPDGRPRAGRSGAGAGAGRG